MPWVKRLTARGGLKGRETVGQAFEDHRVLAALQAARRGRPFSPGHRPSASALGWDLPARWAGGRFTSMAYEVRPTKCQPILLGSPGPLGRWKVHLRWPMKYGLRSASRFSWGKIWRLLGFNIRSVARRGLHPPPQPSCGTRLLIGRSILWVKKRNCICTHTTPAAILLRSAA